MQEIERNWGDSIKVSDGLQKTDGPKYFTGAPVQFLLKLGSGVPEKRIPNSAIQ